VVLAGRRDEQDNIRRSGRTDVRDTRVYGIAVEGVIDRIVFEACRDSERIAGYRQICLSTFGRLRGAGFALLATFDHRILGSCWQTSAR